MKPSDDAIAYLTLALVPGIGPNRLERLRRRFRTWNGALEAPFALLRTVPSITPAAATAIAAASRQRTERILREVAELGGFVLLPDDPGFPALFEGMADPPTLLFGMGQKALLARPAVAIVGSRHPSTYGVSVTRTVSKVAAEAGLVVVSGMARGLDAVAHWAAVSAAGGTIGVLGNGLGVVYPAANKALYQRVEREGLLLTEYPPGEKPHAGSFPQRNRLISALARVTLVVEAAAKSGALRTVSSALEQGREVLCVPGPITSRTSEGVNDLIRTGAAPYLEPDDLLRHYPEVPEAHRAALRKSEPAEALRVQLREELRRVFDAIDGVPRTVDALMEELELPAGSLLQAISELELIGLVDQEAGGFRRVP